MIVIAKKEEINSLRNILIDGLECLYQKGNSCSNPNNCATCIDKKIRFISIEEMEESKL